MTGIALLRNGSRYFFPAQILITAVAWVDRHRLVAEHRLRARRRHDDKSLPADERIFDMPQMPLLLDHFDFLVGQRGAGHGVPIDHAFAAIDQPLFVELDKDALDATAVFRVQRESFARPIARSAQFLELLDDDAAVLFLPCPDFLQEFFPAEVFAVLHDALLAQALLDDRLGGDAGVVGAGQPEDFVAFHARQPRQDVLNGVVEHVPQRQHAGDVGRRNDNRIGRLGRMRIGHETLPLQPILVPFLLNGLRFVRFWNFGHKWARRRRASPALFHQADIPSNPPAPANWPR